jgi:hypothetical protein
MRTQARFGGLLAFWSALQITGLLNHKTPAIAALFSHLNLAAREKHRGCGVCGCAVSHLDRLYIHLPKPLIPTN